MVKVVEECQIFENVEDLMTKCDALLLAQVEISEMEQEKLKLVEEIRQKMVNATNEAAQVILNLDNELDELEVNLPSFVSKILYLLPGASYGLSSYIEELLERLLTGKFYPDTLDPRPPNFDLDNRSDYSRLHWVRERTRMRRETGSTS